MTTPHISFEACPLPKASTLTIAAMAILFVVLLASCGADEADTTGATASEDEVILTTQSDPIDHASAEISTSTEVAFEENNDRGDDPFVPEALVLECEPENLILFLDEEPIIANAWADAAGVEVDEIADTIRTYEARVLQHDTRVTNHAYRGGVARGFQATLEAGTAVLVDEAGVPRVRCACGNPLAPPRPVSETTEIETPTQVPVTTTTVATPVPTQIADFCATWQTLAPTMMGGPAGHGSMAIYLGVLVDGFDQLIGSARVTADFPADALADLTAYRASLAGALASGDLTPGPDDIVIGTRVENFLTNFCGDTDTETSIDLDDSGDDTPTDGTTGHCGSFQFALLIVLADDLGLDHAAISQPFVDAMNNLVDGFDPGPEFDVSDLSLMLGNEEIGCQGAQAMQQLLTDLGFGPLIEGT
ncbi:MAG: hypothetical protein ACI9MX_003365, partial [Candidatus Aldehydirespiratoraceae bacterium]